MSNSAGISPFTDRHRPLCLGADPKDGAAWIHVEYCDDSTCEWVQLDDDAFTNPVLCEC